MNSNCQGLQQAWEVDERQNFKDNNMLILTKKTRVENVDFTVHDMVTIKKNCPGGCYKKINQN